MPGTVGIVDAVAGTTIIEPVGPARMAPPRQNQRVDKPFTFDQLLVASSQFGIDEAEIEQRVVGDQRRFPDECDKVIDDIGKAGFILEEFF